MNVIELGYVDAAPAAPPRPRLDRHRLRRVSAVLVVLLCLGTLTASIKPEPHGLRLLWSIPYAGEGSFTLAGDAVIAISGNGSRTVTAFALADGRQIWSRDLPETVPYLGEDRASPVLLVPTGELVVPLRDGGSQYVFTGTIALDAATGAVLWRASGSGSGWAATGTALLEERTPDGSSIARLRLVRLADGSTVWSRDTPQVQQWIMLGADPARPDRVAMVSQDGDLSVLRLADGTETAAGPVEWAPGSPKDGDFLTLTAEGDALYVLRMTRGRSIATAYSDRTLHRLWRAEQPSAGSGAYPCGAVLCMGGNGELVGYDWVTGAVRWRAPGQEYAMAASRDLLIAGGGPGSSRQTLLEAATGRRLADLGSARPPWTFDGGTLITLGYSSSAPGRTVVSQVDPDTGQIFLLGTIEAITDWGCRLAGKLLLCHHPKGKLTVTAVG
jgi:outer membrane protein assembly factor BamB